MSEAKTEPEAKTVWKLRSGGQITFPVPVTREWALWFLKQWPKLKDVTK